MERVYKKLIWFIVAVFFIVLALVFGWHFASPPFIIDENAVFTDRELSMDAPFRVFFSTAMNKRSTQGAFAISPDISGDFEWLNNQTLLFKPNIALKTGDRYIISINQNAKSWFGKKMGFPYSATYVIGGYPKVIFISPISDNEWRNLVDREVDNDLSHYSDTESILQKNQPLVVTFSDPLIMSEQSLQDDNVAAFQVDLKDYLEISPSINGRFNWIGQSAFEFLPDEATLPMGQYFTATLKKGLPMADGGKLPNDFVWHFQTAEPQIVRVDPDNGAQNVDPTNKLRITWNQKVELESLFKALEIRPDLPLEEKRKIAITHDPADPLTTIVSFEPHFAKDSLIDIVVQEGVQSFDGMKKSTESFESNFLTLADPQIINTWPPAFFPIVPDQPLWIALSTPVAVEELAEFLYFEPEIIEEQIVIERIINEPDLALSAVDNNSLHSKVSYKISVPLLSSGKVDWGLKAGFVDEFGQTFDQGFQDVINILPYPAELKLSEARVFLDPDEPAVLPLSARNVHFVSLKLCQIAENRLLDFEVAGEDWNTFACERDGSRTIAWKEKLNYQINEWLMTEIALFKKIRLTTGVWFLEMTILDNNSNINSESNRYVYQIYAPTASLTLKKAGNKVMVWATDILTGQNIADMNMLIYGNNSTLIASGETDDSGLLEFSTPVASDPFLVIGKKENLVGYIGADWFDNLIPPVSDFAVNSALLSYFKVFLQTDKHIYQYGQKLNYKGVLRQDQDAELSFLELKNVQVKIKNTVGEFIMEREDELSDNGSFFGQFDLGIDIPAGKYFVETYVNDFLIDSSSNSFLIEDGNRNIVSSSLFEEEIVAREEGAGDKVIIDMIDNDSIELEIKADKQNYLVGDLAQLTVYSPYEESMKALVSVERRDIIQFFVTDIQKITVVEIPITDKMIPNVYVSVVLIKDKGVLGKLTKMNARIQELVDLEIPEVDVKIGEYTDKLTSFQSEFDLLTASQADKPQEEELKVLNAKIKVANNDLATHQNKKISLMTEKKMLEEEVMVLKNIKGDLNNAVTSLSSDLSSKPDILLGYTTFTVDTTQKQLLINMDLDQEHYLPKDQVVMDIEIVDAQGRVVPYAEMSVKVSAGQVVDSSTSPNIFEYFYGNSKHNVQTVSSLFNASKTPIVFAQTVDPHDENDLIMKIDSDEDLAYWEPVIIADDQGRATISFDLPEHEADWNIEIQTLSKQDRFGYDYLDLEVNKPLAIQGQLPKFVVNGDTFSASFSVINQSKRAENLIVSLAGDYFMINGSQSENVYLDSGSDIKVVFEGRVMVPVDKHGRSFPLNLKLDIQNSDLSLLDRFEVLIPVKTPPSAEVIGFSGVANVQSPVYVPVPSTALEEIGNVSVNLSLWPVGFGAVDFEKLLNPVYQNIDQLSAKLITLGLLSDPHNSWFKNIYSFDETKIPAEIQDVLTRIAGFQNEDGGFGYWENSVESNPEFSANVLWVFSQMKKRGVSLDQVIVDHLINYLRSGLYYQRLSQGFVNNFIWSDSTKVFALFALSEIGNNDLQLVNQLFEVRENLTVFARIALLMTYRNYSSVGLKDASTKKEIILSEILTLAKRDARGVSFGELTSLGGVLDNTMRATVLAYYALAGEKVDQNLLLDIDKFLFASRYDHREVENGSLNTAIRLLAYSHYANVFQVHDLQKATINLNGQYFADYAWDLDNQFIIASYTQPLDNLKKGAMANEFAFDMSGSHDLFYDISLNYYLPIDSIKERNQELGIIHQYFTLNDFDSSDPLWRIHQGAYIQGKLSLFIPEDQHFIIVNAPLPAGLQPIDWHTIGMEDENYASILDSFACGDNWCWSDNLSSFNLINIDHDGLVLVADYLPAGYYEYRYLASAITQGRFQILPASISVIYDRKIQANSPGNVFIVNQ